ncbi:MAG: efflux RND transporter periplasmic adaptor subunit [Kiloniellales bacterium]
MRSRLRRAATLPFGLMGRGTVGLCFGLALATAVAIGFPGRAEAQATSEATLVHADPVVKEAISRTTTVLGRLVARRGGEVAAQINGPVAEFRVEIGDRVKAGDVLVVLQRDSLAARRALARAHLGEAQAEIATKKAEIELKRQALRRLEALKTSAAFSQARYEDARQEVEIAGAELASAQAAAQSAQAELALAEIDLAKTEIKAPYDGVVTQRLTDAGAYVQSGAPVVQMVADQSLEVEADVPFQYLAGIEPGAAVSFTLEDGSHHEATVRAVIPNENPMTRTRAVRFAPAFGPTRKPLADQQSVRLEIPVSEGRTMLTVHKDAVVRRQGQELVFVVADGKAEARTVNLGEAIGSRLVVIEGLDEGDLAIVRGNERLRPGEAIKVNGQSS